MKIEVILGQAVEEKLIEYYVRSVALSGTVH